MQSSNFLWHSWGWENTLLIITIKLSNCLYLHAIESALNKYTRLQYFIISLIYFGFFPTRMQVLCRQKVLSAHCSFPDFFFAFVTDSVCLIAVLLIDQLYLMFLMD